MATTDNVHLAFLRRQYGQGMELAAESDLLDLAPVEAPWFHPAGTDEEPLVDRYLARYTCKGLVRGPSGEIKEAGQFAVGVWIPPYYLRRAERFEVLTWLGPRNIWHPNISDRGPFICVGRLAPGTPLVDILYQVFEIITYNNKTMREDDALNHAACAWARKNTHLFPVDARPLKRRSVDFSLETAP